MNYIMTVKWWQLLLLGYHSPTSLALPHTAPTNPHKGHLIKFHDDDDNESNALAITPHFAPGKNAINVKR